MISKKGWKNKRRLKKISQRSLKTANEIKVSELINQFSFSLKQLYTQCKENMHYFSLKISIKYRKYDKNWHSFILVQKFCWLQITRLQWHVQVQLVFQSSKMKRQPLLVREDMQTSMFFLFCFFLSFCYQNHQKE